MDIVERLLALERRVDALEDKDRRLGPSPKTDEELREDMKQITARLIEEVKR